MEFHVYSQEREVGQCDVLDDGLYWRVEARCRQERDIPMRLFGGGQMLGVPEREGEWWTLRRRISKKMAADFSETRARFYLLPAQMRVVCVFGFEMHGYLEDRGDHQVLRMAFSAEEAHPCMPLFCFFRIRDGFWEMVLDEDGNPVL